MLDVRNLSAAYGQHPALQDVSLTVNSGEIVVMLGANGAGKSTLLRAIAGICEGEVHGQISLAGESLVSLSSDQIVERGVSLVPEGRGVFADLTVKDNLLLGAYAARARSSEAENLERVLDLFPQLGERQSQVVRTMSGGEQQMVAIGRAMMSAPDILMLDEPSLGLAPLLCQELFHNLVRVKELQIGILLVEQNAKQSLAIADRGYLLENTRIIHQDTAAKLATDPTVQQAYLGGAARARVNKSTQDFAESEDKILEQQSLQASKPHKVTFNQPVGELRRNADQQIGGSIEELVEQAAQTSATRTNGTTTGVKFSTSVVSSNEVDRVTLDIENAAADARKRAAKRISRRTRQQRTIHSATAISRQASATKKQADKSEPVVIEIYKRPRVEVYRRRPTGEFERD